MYKPLYKQALVNKTIFLEQLIVLKIFYQQLQQKIYSLETNNYVNFETNLNLTGITITTF